MNADLVSIKTFCHINTFINFFKHANIWNLLIIVEVNSAVILENWCCLNWNILNLFWCNILKWLRFIWYCFHKAFELSLSLIQIFTHISSLLLIFNNQWNDSFLHYHITLNYSFIHNNSLLIFLLEEIIWFFTVKDC